MASSEKPQLGLPAPQSRMGFPSPGQPEGAESFWGDRPDQGDHWDRARWLQGMVPPSGWSSVERLAQSLVLTCRY